MTRSEVRNRTFADDVLDDDSFTTWDAPIRIDHRAVEYQLELGSAAIRSGVEESVTTGQGTLRGRPVAIISNEFAFLGGSIGTAAADRFVAAVRRATRDRLPLVVAARSGGTRMQEGTPAFLRMIDIAMAIGEHRAAGLAYIVYLRHPTTGGTLASWASLGHMTFAEPGALVGFLGPSVHQLLCGTPFPPDVQTAENLAARGVIDAVVPASELADVVDRALDVMTGDVGASVLPIRPARCSGRVDAWTAIADSRAASRAGAREVLRHGCTSIVELSGTQNGESSAAVLVALARMDGVPCIIVAHDRDAQSHGSVLGPAALRVARRGMDLADELGLPLVCLVDTAGAELSADAENGALAGEIARCLHRMTSLSVPTISVLLGQGCGGGAIALMGGRVIIAAQRSWLAPLPLEGASAIVYGDTAHAEQLATLQKVSATALFGLGLINDVVSESRSDDPRRLARDVAAACGARLRCTRK